MKILRLESESNNYLVINELTDEALLIDCAGNADSLAAEILRRGLKLCGILLTHGHFDHMMWCVDLIAPCTYLRWNSLFWNGPT